MPTYVAIGDAEIAAESPVTVSLMTRLRDNALAYAGAPSGTRALWQQTAAPLGWTKESLYNDYTPRVVNGTVGTGGSVAFSTLFGRTTTDNVTLSQDNLPATSFSGSNTLTMKYTPTAASLTGAATNLINQLGAGSLSATTESGTITVSSGGSATPFSAPIDMRVKYIDNIIAQKD